MIIAIDGTTASGKGTLAKRLAAHFGMPHLDTGLLYRAVGMKVQREGVDVGDVKACARAAEELDLNDFDERELRSAEAGAAASVVAAMGPVRRALLEMQVAFAHQPGGAVLDGRDIGTVIAPDADVKLWIDASLPERARRRCAELAAAGRPVPLDEMIRQLEERDARDRTRADAPMTVAVDAHRIDTTAMTPADVLTWAIRLANSVRPA